MSIEDLRSVCDEFAEKIKEAFRIMMASERGVNDKVGRNTLVDSHIYNELDCTQGEIGLFTVLINYYVDYIESGMKPGHWVKEEYLLPWMAEKGIPTDNETLHKIQGSIYHYGISPRPFVDDSFDQIDQYWDDFADKLFEALCKPLDEFFG